MRSVPPPSLVEQVAEAIISDIVDGELASNARLIQDDLARAYGVSRQPVQQALLLLRSRGLVREAAGRGLIVTPLDIDFVRDLYEVRSMFDGLAAKKAAERGAERARREGPAYLAAGHAAVEKSSLREQIQADMAFHAFLSELSGNRLIAEATEPHWPYLRRVMAEVLRDDERMPQNIWEEHAAILDAVIAGKGDMAEALSREHIARASQVFIQRLKALQDELEQERLRRSRRIPR